MEEKKKQGQHFNLYYIFQKDKAEHLLQPDLVELIRATILNHFRQHYCADD